MNKINPAILRNFQSTLYRKNNRVDGRSNRMHQGNLTKKMLKHRYNEKYKQHLNEMDHFKKIHDNAPKRDRVGKETMNILKSLIHPHVGGNVNLFEPSPYLNEPMLRNISSNLWPY